VVGLVPGLLAVRLPKEYKYGLLSYEDENSWLDVCCIVPDWVSSIPAC
jgi:hypothetical protein